MNIVLLRHGNRALLLPAGRSLLDCPLLVRLWLGPPQTEVTTQITLDTPMPGIHPPLVLGEIVRYGFCALDVYGVVRVFSPAPEKEALNPNGQELDLSATELLRAQRAPPGNPRG